MGFVADLHLHTTNSDGELTLEALPDAARRADLEAVAVTDHDRLHPGLDDPVQELGGITVIHGIELKVEADQRVDLLGYGVTRTDALTAEIDRLQRDRIERGAKIIANVEAELGIDLDLEPREGLGRPHIARAVEAHPGTDLDFQGAFDELIADGRPCFVAREVTAFGRGRELLSAACAFVGLAHPFRYDDPAAALRLTDELDAVERWYPYEAAVDETLLDAAVESNDLLETGGSDAHNDRLGVAGVPGDAFQPIRQRLGID